MLPMRLIYRSLHLGVQGISRFPCALLPDVPEVFDHAEAVERLR